MPGDHLSEDVLQARGICSLGKLVQRVVVILGKPFLYSLVGGGVLFENKTGFGRPWLGCAETKTASLLARPAAPGCRTRYTQMQNSKPRQTEFLQKIVTLIYCDLVAGSLLEKKI